MRRWLALVTFAAATIGYVAPAAADWGDTVDSPGAGVVDGTPEAVVVVGRTGTLGSWSGSGAGGSGSGWRCGYYDVTAGDIDRDDAPEVHYDEGPVDPEADAVYVLTCYDQSGQVVRSQLTRYDPADPLAGIAAVERATDEARRRLDVPLPSPGLNPPGDQLVGVATWLWLDGTWQATSATASIGTVSSTVTATPTEAVWDLGDGTSITCGAGHPYDVGRAPEEQSSDCTHVYSSSSRLQPDGTFLVSVTVSYAVSWGASTGAGGDLETISRTTTVPVRVTEAQALIR